MRKLKKLAVLGLVSVMACTVFTGCGEKKETVTIGVCQLLKHVALDAAYDGFVEGLKNGGYEVGKNLEIDHKDGNGDKSNCQTIASTFVNKNVDMMLGIATDAAQACANASKDIPVLFTAVTDPAKAGIVESNEAPGGNVTGTSDMTPIKEQIDLLTKLLPDAKTVGILYCSNEVNSQIQADIAVAAVKALGLTPEIATVSQTSEIQSVVETLTGKVDVIYTPTDNLIATNMATVSMIATANKVPVICGEDGMVKEGGLATYGLSYYNLGKQTGEMAAKILKGEAKPEDMPVEYLNQYVFSYNEDVAEQLGITIPEELLAEME